MIGQVEQAIQLLEQTERKYEFWIPKTGIEDYLDIDKEIVGAGVSLIPIYIFLLDRHHGESSLNYIFEGSLDDILASLMVFLGSFERDISVSLIYWNRLDPVDLALIKHEMALQNRPVILGIP